MRRALILCAWMVAVAPAMFDASSSETKNALLRTLDWWRL